MDANMLHDIAVEELSCVPEGQGYTIEQFLDHSSIETKNGAKALFSASELGSPSGSLSQRRKTIRKNVALVERACLTQTQQQAILEEVSFMWILRHHPHVINCSNCFLTPNFLAIAGESANMGTFKNFLKRFTRANACSLFQQQTPVATPATAGTAGVPAGSARFLFQQLVMVVDYCHRINESISDSLTPDNVVVCWNGSAPQVKIAATGQSGVFSPIASPTLPSFAFKAPEHILGNSEALTDDIFSLGAMLFFALTGSPPFAVAEGETAEAWASRATASELSIPAHVSQQEGLHELLHGMLAHPELRWTLTDIKQHIFFTTNLPDGALKLSDRVASADHSVRNGPETQRVFRNLRKLLSCCGEAQQSPAAYPTAHTAHAAHVSPQQQHQFVGEALHIGVNVGGLPHGSPVATASGYTAVASSDLSMQLSADVNMGMTGGGCCNVSQHEGSHGVCIKMEAETSSEGNVAGGAIAEGTQGKFLQPYLQQQRSAELANVYQDISSGEEIRVSIAV